MEKYFIAKLIWQIEIEQNAIASEFDEQLRIIKALDAEIALEKSRQIGLNNQETLINNKGQRINWVFINVEFLKEITSFDDGLEICAQTIKIEDPKQYIKEINTKSLLNFESVLMKTN